MKLDLFGIDVNLAIDTRERADSHGQTRDRVCLPDPEYPLGLFRYPDADSIIYVRQADGSLRRVSRKEGRK